MSDDVKISFMSKYIIVTGGVCSSLGKGVATSAIASLLESAGLSISIIKCDPYINVDAGTISPYQYGEVFVTSDGAETDLNLGNYERFTNVVLTRANSITTGKIYERVIKNERAGRFNGRVVQVIPHITDEIKRRIFSVDPHVDVVFVEIGGTVGDIESIPFLEAVRQLIREKGKENALAIHLTLVPAITGGELKTKPTQNSVKVMQETGIQPDILLCRSEVPLDEDLRHKIALFCNVDRKGVFTSIDVQQTIYELPIEFHNQGLDEMILKKLGFVKHKANINAWKNFLTHLQKPKGKVCIGLIGRNSVMDDSFKSIYEALFHAAVSTHGLDLEVKKIDAEKLEKSKTIESFFENIQGIIIPSSYGQRGFLGLLQAISYARENNIPFLGINLGMQLMAVECARNLMGIDDADSTEFIPDTSCPIISLPEEQNAMGANMFMRLGDAEVFIEKKSKLFGVYGKQNIIERHRNKYTFDVNYTESIEKNGLFVIAKTGDGQVAAFEWATHPWGIGVQYHPEFISHPTKPHPLFSAFIKAAKAHE